MGDALFLNLCHPDDLHSIGPHLETVRQMADGDVAHLEYRMRHKDGSWVWLLGYDTVFERDESGKVTHHLGIATDITLQKIAQEQALAERRAADTANEELRSLAYSMSHDMKAPSNTLQLLLKELNDGHGHLLDDDAKELMNLSLKTVAKMQGLVNDVLSYTQVVGREDEYSHVDLNDVVNNVIQDLHADICIHGAEVLVDDLPIVRGSRMQLGILFHNLISNALKYHLSDSTPKVRISSTANASDQLTFVHVKDNGIGIALKHHRKIFKMFKRLHISEEYPGTGLGLAICKRIVLMHHGGISVQSAPFEGSTFSVSFNQ